VWRRLSSSGYPPWGGPPTFTAASTEASSVSGDDQGGPSLVGASVDRYLVVDEIGAGGMGVVYKAYDPDLGRLVALKLVRAGASTRAATRLEREARAIARLAHPNVVTVYDVGEHGDQIYIVMELIEGLCLREWLIAGPRPQRMILDAFLQAARGLAAAHDAGLVHRDFKPDNVLVGDDGRVRVLDFGLARGARDEDSADDAPIYASPERAADVGGLDTVDAGSDLARSLTPTGAAVGTPRYMAPEQHLGDPCDARADQFAWGVALYEALTRRHPFEGDAREMRRAAIEGRVRPISEAAGVPDWLAQLVRRALAVVPAERYPSMHDVAADLIRDRSVLRRTALNGSASTEPMVAAFPPPDQAAGRVHRLRARLDSAWRQKSRGLLGPSMEMARRVAAEARDLDYPPLYAAALYLVGNLQHRTGQSPAACATLHEAARIAARAGDDWQVANTWIFLVLVLGAGLGRTEEALTMAQVAEVALDRVGDNASLRSRLCNYRGAALAAAGRCAEAADAIACAVALDEVTHGPNHTFLVASLLNLAEVWLDAGDPARARAPLERTREIIRPDEDPPTASRTRWRALWGRMLLAAGDAAGARDPLEKAVAVWERQPGRERALADALLGVAHCLRAAGDVAAARAAAERAALLARAVTDARLGDRAARELAALPPLP